MRRFFKIFGYIVISLLVVAYVIFYFFTQPISDDSILEKFEDAGVSIELSYEKFQEFEYRKISVKSSDSLPTIVFAHGTIGSCIDFFEYMIDKDLRGKANFIAYDRVGYGYEDPNSVQESIQFESQHFQHVYKNHRKGKIIKIGYSYGGPIVLADTLKTRKTILIAPAVCSEVEPMPTMINLYKWKLTRWLVPDIWKEASKEKLSHKADLKNFERDWNRNKNEILIIHGDDDGIVPLENSKYLVELFPDDQLKLVTLQDADHGLVWTQYEEIKQQLLNVLNENI